jgi:hypothetical protein
VPFGSAKCNSVACFYCLKSLTHELPKYTDHFVLVIHTLSHFILQCLDWREHSSIPWVVPANVVLQSRIRRTWSILHPKEVPMKLWSIATICDQIWVHVGNRITATLLLIYIDYYPTIFIIIL